MADIAADIPTAVANADSPPAELYPHMQITVTLPIQGGEIIVVTGSNGSNLNNGLN